MRGWSFCLLETEESLSALPSPKEFVELKVEILRTPRGLRREELEVDLI